MIQSRDVSFLCCCGFLQSFDSDFTETTLTLKKEKKKSNNKKKHKGDGGENGGLKGTVNLGFGEVHCFRALQGR